MTDPSAWEDFERDPRRVENAHLRASDSDREVVHRVLVDAFSDGRLDREEFDERTDAVRAAKTLGELPAFVVDLVPSSPLGGPIVRSADLDKRAEARYVSERRSAVWSFLSVSLLCWFIYLMVSIEPEGGQYFDFDFPWPIFPTVALMFHVGGTIARRQDIMDRERRRLERRAMKDLAQQRRLEPPPA